MVAPSAFAETVTPPMASPAADLMVPLKSASAKAGAARQNEAAAATARFATTRPHALRIGFSMLMRLIGLAGATALAGFGRGRRCGNCLDVGDDGVDLRRFELDLKTRHVRAAVADDVAHDLGLAAERRARQHRRKRRVGDL